MDVMELRRMIMSAAGGNGMVGIKQSKVVVDASSASITFPVDGKPWGFLISNGSDSNAEGNTNATVTRADGIWTEYGGGQYAGGRVAMTKSNGTYDHYNLPNTSIVYDDSANTLTVTSPLGVFYVGVTYYLWYFTIPF